MSHLVITIGCEYGAKGNQIGRKIAEDLGFQFYDRNIVDAIIHEVGIPGEIMEKVEEGVTIVMITHDAKIASYAKRVIRIIDGEIEEAAE